MTASPDVQERDGAERAGQALERQREARGLEILARNAGHDVANITDDQFDAGVARMKTMHERMERLIKEVLELDVDYGNPVISEGENPKRAFDKKMLYISGAEKLRRCYGLTIVHVGEPRLTIEGDFVSALVTVGCQDRFGNVYAPRSGSCNTKEKRFQRKGGGGYTYTDPREKVHDCIAMAEKRAGTLSTREATGATGFFQVEDELDRVLGEAEGAEPWSTEERDAWGKAASAAGLKTGKEKQQFLDKLLNRATPAIPFKHEVKAVHDALAALKDTKVTPVRATGYDQPTPTAKASTGEAATQEDLSFDQRLAAE